MSEPLHSSLIPRGQWLPKTVNGKTRHDERREKDTAEAANWRNVCRLVDTRDDHRCRVCKRRVVARAIDSRERGEHHHLIKRSQGGEDITANVVLLCVGKCHDDIHVRALMKLAGDADARDHEGRLCGVRVERYLDGSDWQVVKWV